MTRSAINRASKAYAGLDVSLTETAICVVDDAGKIVFERSAATDPQVIAKYLAKHAPGGEAVVGAGLNASKDIGECEAFVAEPRWALAALPPDMAGPTRFMRPGAPAVHGN